MHTTTSDTPASAGRVAQLQHLFTAAVPAVTALICLAQLGALHGLAKAAGQSPKGGGAFGAMQKYLENLQDAVIPLVIPAACLGLIGGGILYLTGSQNAQRIMGGVVMGLGLVLLSPELIK